MLILGILFIQQYKENVMPQNKHLEQVYPNFLQANGCLFSAVELAKVSDKISHDQVSRFLAAEKCPAAKLWQKAK
jgi:hypothetical protein